MHPELQSALNAYRSSRCFDPERYLQAKSSLINAYFTQSGISGCVVGVSGGVDSAVTLGIIAHAARQSGSPIRRILALLLPMHGEGATHQDTASSRGAEVAAAFGVPSVTVDLSSTLTAAREASVASTGIKGTAWASGQLVSYLRTPMLYYQTALLTEQGFRSIACGTTNRDEGSYIGFFGKASDGMVDIQPVSDIHKSEVYQLADGLGVPSSVITAVPTGDTYDGACDEDMIGAPYDALEIYTWYLCTDPRDGGPWRASLCPDAQSEFMSWEKKFERLHQVNTHKYIGDSPAVHLDLYPRAVPGGWRTQEVEQFPNPIPHEGALAMRVGPIELTSRLKHALRGDARRATSVKSLADFGESAMLLRDVLSAQACDEFLRDAVNWPWVPADIHGRVLVPNSELLADEEGRVIGSYRSTAYDEEVAQLLWDRLAPSLPGFRTMNDFTPTDWNDHPVWRPVGINPMLRFIRYEKGGVLVPHYDAGFDFKDGRKHTLMSVVITLTPPSQGLGGNTRFLIDHQRFLPLDERNYTDHDSQASSCDILVEVPAKAGDVLVFDHRVLHDGSTWNGTSPRILLRTDIIYERCSSHAIHVSKRSAPLPPLPPKKWARDPTFANAYRVLGGMKEIEEAGYFEDGLEYSPRSDPRWWTAPFDKILKNLAQPKPQDSSKELYVLVSTGAFSPVHAGHLEMMERAKIALEERGHAILGGYLAPDHDSYISRKCGADFTPAAQRLDLCERAVRNSDWLMVERWAALHVPAAVNFTAVIQRLEKHLAYYVRTHRPIHIAFVCGSDNARFAKAFAGRGSCVCVLRPGYEAEFKRIAEDPVVQQNPRIVFTPNVTSPWTSSNVRRGDIQALPEEVKDEWLRLRTINHGRDVQTQGVVSLYVRNEGDWAVQSWEHLPGMDPTRLHQAYQTFSKGLVTALEESFSRGRKLEGGPDVQSFTLDLDNQKRIFQGIADSSPIISLDPCLPGAVNMEVSRCFEPLSRVDPGFVARPGAEPIATQLERLENTSYILFDDDTFTGHTRDYVRALVESRCRVAKFATLCDASGPLSASPEGKKKSDYPPRLNHVDCRDFLVGAREAGLVVRLPDGSLCRAPYMLPYVRPHYQASVYLSEEIEFSRRVWGLNRRFFEDLGATLRVLDMGGAFRRLCEVQSFSGEMTMEELCDWHLEYLNTSSVPSNPDST
jgi:NAD+ synthetase